LLIIQAKQNTNRIFGTTLFQLNRFANTVEMACVWQMPNFGQSIRLHIWIWLALVTFRQTLLSFGIAIGA